MQELSSGDRFEGYRIVQILGAGGMGDVYEAIHEDSDQKVALKCLKVRHSSKEDARARMKMEAVVLSELQHANLVRVYDGGITKTGTMWFAMERLYGETLRELLYRTGALPAAEALYFASEVADGVDAVHAVKVVHRDLKPENIFITHQRQVKVLDLGTGKFTGYGLDSTDRMRIVGTTAYMAPEQIKGLPVDPRADVYSLGLVVYEMLTGRHALLSALGGELPEDMERLALMQLQSHPVALDELLPDLPPYVASVVSRAIAKKREERFSSMSEFARELRVCGKRLMAEEPEGRGLTKPRSAEDLRQKLGAHLPTGAPLKPRILDARPIDGGVRPVVADGPTLPAIAARALPAPIIRVVETPHGERIEPNRLSQLAPLGGGTRATELISLSSDGSAPEDTGPETEPSLPPHAARVRTTNTNPLLLAAIAETPLPFEASGPSSEQQTVAAVARHEPSAPSPRMRVRRLGMTIVLGAVLGLPPTLLGISWVRHHRSSTRESPQRGAAAVPGSMPARAEARLAPRGAVSIEPAHAEGALPAHAEGALPAHAENAEPSNPGGPAGAGGAPVRRGAAHDGTPRESGKPIMAPESTSALVSPDWSRIDPGQVQR